MLIKDKSYAPAQLPLITPSVACASVPRRARICQKLHADRRAPETNRPGVGASLQSPFHTTQISEPSSHTDWGVQKYIIFTKKKVLLFSVLLFNFVLLSIVYNSAWENNVDILLNIIYSMQCRNALSESNKKQLFFFNSTIKLSAISTIQSAKKGILWMQNTLIHSSCIPIIL